MLSTAPAPSVRPAVRSSLSDQHDTLGRLGPQLKMASTGKAIDGARKQAGSPIDPPPRKQPQKAWTGSNPLTQRSSNMAASNGVVSSSKPASLPRANATQSLDSHTSDKHAHDRLLFILSACKGLVTEFTLKNGQQYSGVLSGASVEAAESRYVFKMVKRIHSERVNGSNGTTDEYAGDGDDHVMSVDMDNVADVSIKNVGLDKNQARTQNGTSTSFRTDTDISGNLSFRERNLQRWEPSNDIPANLSLEDAAHSKPWDQFEANERLYGLTSNYDEDIYTTKIDRSNPLYKQREAEAERIAREIESTTAFNAHVAEERGQAVPDDSGMDEEEKYSGVRRGEYAPLPTGQPNKYTPPAKRAPTGQPGVPGVPVDPAIISSQIAKPGAAKAPTPVPASTPTSTPAPASNSENASAEKPKSPAPAEAAEEPAKTEPAPSTPSTQADASKTKAAAAAPAAASDSKPAAKPAQDASQKPAPIKPVTALNAAGKKAGKTESATANVEHELLDQFKQFTANEKLRLRNMARHDKAVKLNDLKSFSKTFKLHTPVPQDLVPILAKDEAKQKQIVEKALRNASDHKTTPPKATAAPPPAAAEAKPAAAAAAAAAAATTAAAVAAAGASASASASRQPSSKYDSTHSSPTVERQQARQRQGQNNFAPGGGRGNDRQPMHHLPPIPNRGQNALLSQRLALAQQHHKAGTMHPGFPPPIPMPPAGPSASSSGGQTPTSSVSGRFNAGATPFVPNPAANTFRPGGGNTSTGSSPRVETPVRQEPRPIKLTSFFGNQRPASSPDVSLLDGAFNVIRRIRKEMQDAGKADEFSNNGGIPQAYRTGPTWDVPDSNRDTTHKDMFDRMVPAAQPISAPQASLGGVPMPHQHQLPPHLQQIPPAPQNNTPHHTPRHPAVQPHHGPGSHHFESGGHPMQFSASTSSVHPSPRPAQPYIYAQAPQAMPPTAMYQQPMPGYGMSPSMQHVHLRQPAPAQFAQVPGMGGHMMTNQPSAGPQYMVPMNPQMQVYSPTPGQVYPHPTAAIPPPPGAGGYPSPRPPGAQMMQHQGSQQGVPPQPIMYMPAGQPPIYAHMPVGPMNTPGRHYPQPHPVAHYGSPHQGNMFPQQNHRGTPSATYSQPMMPSHSMGGHPQQMVPPPNGPASHVPNGDEAK